MSNSCVRLWVAVLELADDGEKIQLTVRMQLGVTHRYIEHHPLKL